MSSRARDGTFTSWLIIGIGLVLTAIAAYAVFSSKGYQRAYQQNEAKNAAYSEREGHYRGCFMLPSIEQARECAENPPKTSRAEKRAEEDLNAQREMADWAEGVLWATLASVAVTAIGIVFVWQTLKANAAAVEIAAKALRVDSEPFLILKPTDHCFVLENGRHLPLAISCVIENTGKGAAEITGIFRAWQVVKALSEPTPVRLLDSLGKTADFVGWRRKAFQLPIGPNGRTPIISSLSNEHARTGEQWADGDWIYFLGYVEYREPAGDTSYKSGFCYVWRPELSDLGLHVAFSDTPDEYWYHERQSAERETGTGSSTLPD